MKDTGEGTRAIWTNLPPQLVLRKLPLRGELPQVAIVRGMFVRKCTMRALGVLACAAAGAESRPLT